jgi:hypothetical protein
VKAAEGHVAEQSDKKADSFKSVGPSLINTTVSLTEATGAVLNVAVQNSNAITVVSGQIASMQRELKRLSAKDRHVPMKPCLGIDASLVSSLHNAVKKNSDAIHSRGARYESELQQLKDSSAKTSDQLEQLLAAVGDSTSPAGITESGLRTMLAAQQCAPVATGEGASAHTPSALSEVIDWTSGGGSVLQLRDMSAGQLSSYARHDERTASIFSGNEQLRRMTGDTFMDVPNSSFLSSVLNMSTDDADYVYRTLHAESEARRRSMPPPERRVTYIKNEEVTFSASEPPAAVGGGGATKAPGGKEPEPTYTDIRRLQEALAKSDKQAHEAKSELRRMMHASNGDNFQNRPTYYNGGGSSGGRNGEKRRTLRHSSSAGSGGGSSEGEGRDREGKRRKVN